MQVILRDFGFDESLFEPRAGLLDEKAPLLFLARKVCCQIFNDESSGPQINVSVLIRSINRLDAC